MAPPEPQAAGAAPSMAALSRGRLVATVAGLMLCILFAALEQTVVGTATPRIVSSLGGLDRYSWVFTAYLVASTAIVPVAGKVSDLYGRKEVLVTGLAFFTLGSVAAGASQTMGQLIGFRVFQGLGAGIIFAVTFVVVSDLFPPAERGKWQGLFSGAFGVASLVGPPLGGWLTAAFSWRAVFYVNLPVGVAAFAVLLLAMPRIHTGRRPRLDIPGVFLLLAGLVPFLVALSIGGQTVPWGSPSILALFAVAAVGLALFLRAEARAAEPVLPLGLFRERAYTVGVAATFLLGIGMFAPLVYLPLYLQGVMGMTPAEAGTWLIPMSVATTVSSTLSGQMIARTGRYRWLGVAGTALFAAGLFLMSRLGNGPSTAFLLAAILLTGFGLGVTFPVYVISVQNALPDSVIGVATSSVQFFRTVGGAVGVAAAGAIIVNRLTGHLAVNVEPAVMDALREPGGVVRPNTLMGDNQASLVERLVGLAEDPQALLERVVSAARVGLSDALTLTFLLAAGTVAAAVLVAYFNRDIPLRRGAVATKPSAE